MKLKQTIGPAFAITMCLASTGLAQEGAARAAIEAANKEFGAAFARGDAAAIASMYATDARLFPPNAEVVSGREAILKFWQGGLTPGMTLTLTSTEVVAHGDMAHETGSWVIAGKDGAQADRGKYVVIWKQEGGAWKLYRDIWNSSMPAEAAKP